MEEKYNRKRRRGRQFVLRIILIVGDIFDGIENVFASIFATMLYGIVYALDKIGLLKKFGFKRVEDCTDEELEEVIQKKREVKYMYLVKEDTDEKGYKY